jgi:hypothetical protein
MSFPIIIASSVEYEPIHLQRLITNVTSLGLNDSIYIISGGHSHEYIENINGITVIRVPYRCFEFTPFIYIVNNPDRINFEYAFFTHDTVEFGNTFYDRIKTLIDTMRVGGYETKKIDCGMSMNIGIYTKDTILRNSQRIMGLCLNSNDPDILLKMKHKLVYEEDVILRSAKLYPHASNPKMYPFKTITTHNEPITCYKKVYTDIDFVKYQTNHCKIVSIYSPATIL